jgi:hypothetical protein
MYASAQIGPWQSDKLHGSGKTKERTMITDLRWQADLIAALQLEPPFKGEPMVRAPSEHDAIHLRHRLELVRKWTIRAQGRSINKVDSAASRAAANIAVWRTYLPDDCVAAMIEDGWHWST